MPASVIKAASKESNTPSHSGGVGNNRKKIKITKASNARPQQGLNMSNNSFNNATNINDDLVILDLDEKKLRLQPTVN